jgi:hypothetical protein
MFYHIEPQDSISLLIAHMHNIRKIEGFGGAKMVIVPESNLGFEAIWVQHEVNRSGIGDICVMREDDNRAGVRVNNQFKHLMAQSLNAKIREGSIYFHEKFLCIGDSQNPESMRNEIVQQLLGYSRIVKPSNNKYGRPTETYCGKAGGGYDDHAIALQLNLVMHRRFMEKSQVYSQWY